MTRRLAVSDTARWATAVLQRAGLTDEDADVVAQNLAYAESRGTASHGFIRLPIYLERVEKGGINAAHAPSTLWDLGSVVALDGDAGPGAATAVHAVRLAITRARESGIGCVLVSNANHFGAAAFYSEMIADEGMIGIVCCNTDRAMCAPGGGEAVLGTNPLTIALPLSAEDRPILDMATSEVSYGRVLVAAAAGQSIPTGWAVDDAGRATESSSDALRGALLPAAGPKGFGLAFMIDALVALGGAKTSPFVSPLHGDASLPQELGHFFLALRGPGDAAAESDRVIRSLVEELRRSRLPSSPAVLFPGEPELMRRRDNDGTFPASIELIESIQSIAERYAVPAPMLP
ncbi:Ldh family oxidoreductase [Microbacterium sp. ISL-59]|uniref:Ldh family oxidoreductase n=1 Tax=Microbacterium sp. ISL-59 TaxID=2819159 RepID=UPI001BECC144|nr:Ldh family oxidoreductase [Microbacterium sp. ISL-59]MBT2495629.1 Ldh family oxidoreductase [Microbacterium sp. ISL-59]